MCGCCMSSRRFKGKEGGIFMESGAKNVFYFRPTICVHEAHESIFHEKIKN